ncbi:MAG: ImmA/IrrE family metallo-endopeptidase [Pseudomonadota bacterium]
MTTADILARISLSDDQLSEKSGIDVDRIQEIRAGGQASLSELRTLASGLGVSLASLVTASSADDADKPLLFRRTGNQTSELDRARTQVWGYVFAALEFLPKQPTNHIFVRTTPPDETYETAARLANSVRELLAPGRLFDPMADLVELVGAKAGVIVAPLRKSRFEGASLLVKGRPFIFVSPRFTGRMLFTIAHELGHLIAHHPFQSEAIFEKSSEIGGRRQRQREAFVDAFASALLMPTEGVARMLGQVRKHLGVSSDKVGDIEILLLARFYGVSFDVAARRLEGLDIIPPGAAQSLADKIKAEFGSPEKRAEQAKLPPRTEITLHQISPILLDAILPELEAGKISAGWISNQFGVSAHQLFNAHREYRRESRH